MKQAHARFRQGTSAFAVITGGAGGDQVGPGMWAAKMFGLDMIHGKKQGVFSAVLASELIASKDFPAAQTDFWMGSMHHTLQTNDRRDGVKCVCGFDSAAAVENKSGFFRQHETQCALKTTHIDRFKICIQHKDRLIHIISLDYSASRKKIKIGG